jgi:hypothetical protein
VSCRRRALSRLRQGFRRASLIMKSSLNHVM